jgi:GNAT superfamily N-acetyltransferase
MTTPFTSHTGVHFNVAVQYRNVDGEESELVIITNQLTGDICSSAIVRIKPDSENALLISLYTHEKHRDHGLGSRVIEEAEDIGRRYQMKRLSLSVEPGNLTRVQQFYQNRGFQPVYQFSEGEFLFVKGLQPDPKLHECRKTLGFFASVIKSGESWTKSCQTALDGCMSDKTEDAR